jgi:hypothetical protein
MTIAAQVLARGDEVIEQSGDFRSWHETDMPPWSLYVCCWGQSGKHMLGLSSSRFDPIETPLAVTFSPG